MNYDTSKIFSIQFRIERVIFSNKDNDFKIASINCIKYIHNENADDVSKMFDEFKITDEVIIKGDFPDIKEADVLKATCKWVEDKKYGYQLQALVTQAIIPEDVIGIRRYLERFVKGIGKKTAELITEKYGKDAINIIKDDETALLEISGIGKNKAKRIRESILKNNIIEEISVFLFSHGVKTYNEVMLIYDAFKEKTREKIIADPYEICDKISIGRLPLADRIALTLGYEPDSVRRISKIILAYLQDRTYGQGDMYVYSDEIVKDVIEYVHKKKMEQIDVITPEKIEETLKYMEFNSEVVADVDDNNKSVIYSKRMYDVERIIVRDIIELNNKKDNTQINNDYEFFRKKFEKDNKCELEDYQLKAVQNANENQVSILTGGPGTGKTFTVNAILSFWKTSYPNAVIKLCAPSGKAAKRMSEATQNEAYTIHRLLGIGSDNDSEYSEEVDFDYIICDECSMVDASIFAKLLEAVVERNATLLLVGDKDQLPPVGPGLAFKDLIECGIVPTVKLEKLFRQAAESQINQNAKKILAGVTGQGDDKLQTNVDKQDFLLIQRYRTYDIKETIIKSMEWLISHGTKLEDIIILSGMKNVSNVGVNALNEAIQERFNPAKNENDEISIGEHKVRKNDIVMQLKNNYKLEVFNGDVGKVIKIDNDEKIIYVEYTNELKEKFVVEYEPSQFSQITLAYAMTVHKSEGSEYPVVIMPFSTAIMNLTRNLVYTAVTRAKKMFVAVGPEDTIYQAIAKDDNSIRNTQIKSKILKRYKERDEKS